MKGLFPKKYNSMEKDRDNDVKSIFFDRFERQYKILIEKMNISANMSGKKHIKKRPVNSR